MLPFFATAGTKEGKLVEFNCDIDPVNLTIFLQDNGIPSDACNVFERCYIMLCYERC